MLCWYCKHIILLPPDKDVDNLPRVGQVPVHTFRVTCDHCGAGYHHEIMLDAPPTLKPEELERRTNRPAP